MAYTIITHVSINIDESPSQSSRITYDYGKINDSLTTRLSPSNRPVTDDPNELLDYFQKIVIESFEEFSTTQTVHRKSAKNSLPWMNDHLESLIKTQLNLFRKAKQRPHDRALKLRLRKLNDEVDNLNLFYMEEYYDQLFQQSELNPKKMWNKINQVLGKGKKEVDVDKLITNDGRTVTFKQEIADSMNVFFTEVGHELDGYLEVHPNDGINNLNTLKRNEQTFFLLPTNEYEVQKLIDSLDTNKSVGHDRLSAFMLKRCSHTITGFLTDLINLTITTGIYPDSLKTAIVTPIHKKGSKATPLSSDISCSYCEQDFLEDFI